MGIPEEETIDERVKKLEEGFNKLTPKKPKLSNTKAVIRSTANKPINAKVLLVFCTLAVVNWFFVDAPIWVKILNTLLPTFAALFNIEVPNIKNYIKEIWSAMSKTGEKGEILSQIYHTIKSLSYKWVEEWEKEGIKVANGFIVFEGKP